MGIEFRNLTDTTIVIDLVRSATREAGQYPMAPQEQFIAEPGDSGWICGWIDRRVSFTHLETSAHVYMGQRPLEAGGLDQSPRSIRRFLASRSQTIRGLSIRFTPVIRR